MAFEDWKLSLRQPILHIFSAAPHTSKHTRIFHTSLEVVLVSSGCDDRRDLVTESSGGRRHLRFLKLSINAKNVVAGSFVGTHRQ